MDALYFYEAIPFQKEEFVTIFFRTEILLFDRLFDEDKTIAKYIEPIADDEKEMLLWVFKFLDCAFLRAEIKGQSQRPDGYRRILPSNHAQRIAGTLPVLSRNTRPLQNDKRNNSYHQ